MKTVILAAGFGSRLASQYEPKPLAPICGLPMLEIGIGQAARAGCDEVIVVTGHLADEIEQELGAIAARVGVKVTSRRVADWSKPNGYSVIAGAKGLTEPFLLVMADHLLSAEILVPLADQAGPSRGVTLAIDRRVDSPLVDPDDATWVKLDETGYITAIGKHLTEFDAVDCGAFLATPELPQAIAAAIAQGKSGSLSDGMQLLADQGRAATMDIGEAWWLDVDDPRAHALAEEQAADALSLPIARQASAAAPEMERA